MRSSFLLLISAAAIAACSSSSGSSSPGDGGTGSSGGSSGGSSIIPDAFLAATVGVGPSSPATVCNLGATASWLDVGTALATGKPVTVSDGQAMNGSVTHVSCTVTAVGSGFDVDLSVTAEGLNGGSVTITSPSGQGAVTATGGTGITGVFQSVALGTYRETDCSITFTYDGQPVNQSPVIAAGRIWGHLSCPAAQASGETLQGPDGGTEAIQCDGEADFLFEQCSQ